MNKTKESVILFCNYLHYTVESKLNPDHVRNAKYNKICEGSTEAFWNTLDNISYVALAISPKYSSTINDNILQYDRCTKVKLRLAFLKTPLIDIYMQSDKNLQPRMLLSTLVWLVESHGVLEHIVYLKLLNSSLGREFSSFYESKEDSQSDDHLIAIDLKIKNLLCDANKINYNIKEIFELIIEKVKLMTKVHAASITASGLPHLSVKELALIKNIAIKMKENSEIPNESHVMQNVALMLETNIKWIKIKDAFNIWMCTVLDEYAKTNEPLSAEDISGLIDYIIDLRSVVKQQLKQTAMNPNYNEPDALKSLDYPGRHLRDQKSNDNIDKYFELSQKSLDVLKSNVSDKRDKILSDLKSLFDMIPLCAQV